MQLLTLKGTRKPTIENIVELFDNIDSDDIDADFGVNVIDDSVYTIRVRDDSVESMTSSEQDVWEIEGPFVDTPIQPFD